MSGFRSLRMVPVPEQIDALGATLGSLDEMLMTDNDRAEALVWAWEGMRKNGIEVRQPASGIETEGQDRADGLGAKHESPPEGDAQTLPTSNNGEDRHG